MALTNTACKNAQPREKPYKLGDSAGMYLEVTPHGSKLWRLKYRFAGREKRLALGIYPEVSLAEAREKRETARKLLKSGIDPSFAKKEDKRKLRYNAETTFRAIAEEWHEHKKEGWTETYGAEILHRMKQDLFPEIGYLPIADISALQLLDTIRKIENRGAHEMARRALQTVSQVFRYAIVTGRSERNPAADLKGALKPVKHGHYAALEAKDLPEFIQTLERNDARLYAHTRNAVKLLMLTFVRTSELIQAKWDEFDLENAEWSIPAERMKMRQPHIVPLSRQAIAILEEQKKNTGNWEWVFPNQVRPKKPMSNNTILMALSRMGYKGRMTGHGFRALAMSTIKEKLGYRHEVVDRQLAHAPRNQVDAAYDRAKFLDERRKMMQEWANYLDAASSNDKIVVAKLRKVS